MGAPTYFVEDDYLAKLDTDSIPDPLFVYEPSRSYGNVLRTK